MTPLVRGHVAWKKRGKMRRFSSFSIHSGSLPPSFPVGHSFGLVVKKKMGCAVKRNRIKRRLRSAFFHVNRHYDLPPGAWFHVLVVHSADIVDQSFDCLLTTLASHIQHPLQKKSTIDNKKINI